MSLNSIQVRMLFLIALDNGANQYTTVLRNFSRTDIQKLLNSGLVKKFGVDNSFLEVNPVVESMVDQFISSATNAIRLGMSTNND